MSEKIREIIDIIEIVKESENLRSEKTFNEIRLEATRIVARKRRISVQSVQDKYIRKIKLEEKNLGTKWPMIIDFRTSKLRLYRKFVITQCSMSRSWI